MRGTVYCPGAEVPEFQSGVIVCSGSGSPQFVADTGLDALSWSDTLVLAGAFLVSASLAVGYNLVGKLLWGR